MMEKLFILVIMIALSFLIIKINMDKDIDDKDDNEWD